MKIILDTDLGGDIDDLGAMAVLHALLDAGDDTLAAVISDTPQGPALTTIAAVNRWYGRPDVPVGRPAEVFAQQTYADVMEQRTGGCPPWNAYPRDVDLYRRVLAGSGDGEVVVVTIGVLFALRDLLASGPDEHSPLDGVTLFKQKVDRVVTMGGHDPGGEGKPETNFSAWGQPDVTAGFVGRCPVPMVFVPGTLGRKEAGFGTGRRLNELPTGHPLHVGYRHFFTTPPPWVDGGPWADIQPWSIWDLIAVFHGLRPDHAAFRARRGRQHVEPDGSNRFVDDPDGPHAMLEPAWPAGRIADELIEPLMLTRPTAVATP